MSGTKHDQKKAPIHFLTKEFLEGVAQAQGFGAAKYGDYNFCDGIEYTRLTDAAMRHILAFVWGENLDNESKLNHIYHAAANLNMLSFMIHNKPEMDNRYKTDNPKLSDLDNAKLREFSQQFETPGLNKTRFLDFSNDTGIRDSRLKKEDK